jgi:hypothetical protein
MEAGVKETEENNAIIFAFGRIILHRSLFPSMSILSLFVFALFVYWLPVPSHSILSSERTVFNKRNLPFVLPDLHFSLRFKLRIKIR